MNDIVFLDMDETLGNWYKGGNGLYPGARDFLVAQREKGRRLYIASSNGDETVEKNLVEIDNLLDGRFSSDQIGRFSGTLYTKPNGIIGKVNDDYANRKDLLPPEERDALVERLNGLDTGEVEFVEISAGEIQVEIHEEGGEEVDDKDTWTYWYQKIHRETGKFIDKETLYSNPYVRGKPVKDLHLARRLICPDNYGALRTVMVGDENDESYHNSDPETPLIVISDRVRKGNWDSVNAELDGLFADKEKDPQQVFDGWYDNGKAQEANGGQGHAFSLRRIQNYIRVLYCPGYFSHVSFS